MFIAFSVLLIGTASGLIYYWIDFYIKCAGRQLCAEVCLADKIEMDGGFPVWQEIVQCHGCFACLNSACFVDNMERRCADDEDFDRI